MIRNQIYYHKDNKSGFFIVRKEAEYVRIYRYYNGILGSAHSEAYCLGSSSFTEYNSITSLGNEACKEI